MCSINKNVYKEQFWAFEGGGGIMEAVIFRLDFDMKCMI